MPSSILPENFDELLRVAVCRFWSSRASGKSSQAGTRGNVIAGNNLDGFIEVAKSVACNCGVPESSIFTRGKTDLTLPGYYRPTKNWDVVIVDRQRLLAVLEFKSQVGSFGNNFNNRTEEALGSATDLWAAAQRGAFEPENHTGPLLRTSSDPRPPFLGYLMLLEDCHDSVRSVESKSTHYRVLPELVSLSYSERYRILAERLMERQLYSAASLLLSAQTERGLAGEHRSLSDATSVRNLFAQLAGHLLAAGES